MAFLQRLMRDFRRLQKDPPQGINGSPNSDNIMRWNAVIFGPEDTPWDGGNRLTWLIDRYFIGQIKLIFRQIHIIDIRLDWLVNRKTFLLNADFFQFHLILPVVSSLSYVVMCCVRLGWAGLVCFAYWTFALIYTCGMSFVCSAKCNPACFS